MSSKLVDRVYGAAAGTDVTVAREVAHLPAGALILVGMSDNRLRVVSSIGRMYALQHVPR